MEVEKSDRAKNLRLEMDYYQKIKYCMTNKQHNELLRYVQANLANKIIKLKKFKLNGKVYKKGDNLMINLGENECLAKIERIFALTFYDSYIPLT